MGYLAVIFPLAFLGLIGWVFIGHIIPQLQRALGA